MRLTSQQHSATTQFKEETNIEGTTGSVDVDGDSETADVRAEFDEFTVRDDYSEFFFFEEYEEDDGLSVIESATLNPGGSETTEATVSTDVEEELDAEMRLTLDQGDIEYEADFLPDVEVGENIYLLGEEWGVTDVSGDDVEVGEVREHRNLAAGDEVEHEDWSFEIIDVDRDDNQVRIDVYEDDDFVESATLAEDEDDGDIEGVFGDDDEFQVEVDDIWFGDQLDQVHIDTTLTQETLENDERFYQDEDWVLDIEADEDGGEDEEGSVSSITLSNHHEYLIVEDDDDDELDSEDERHALSPSDTIMGPNDYFEVENHGFETEDITEETVLFEEELQLDYTDHNGVDHDLELEDDLINPSDLEDGEDGYIVVETEDEDGYGVPVYVNIDTWERDGDTTEVDFTVEYGDATLDIDQENEDSGLDNTIEFSGPDFSFDIELDNDVTGAFDNNLGTVSGLQTSEYGLISAHGLTWDENASEGEELEVGDAMSTWNDLDASDGVALALHERDEDGSSDSSVVATYETSDGEDDDPVAGGFDDDLSTGEIVTVAYDGDGDDGFGYDADQDETITDYGTHVTFGGEDAVSLMHPTEMRGMEVSIGDAEATEGTEGQTVETVADQEDLPNMAQLDDDVVESDRANNHLILVGGPAVNTLTEELHSDGDIDLSEVEDEQSGALLQVVEDAFADGQHAMVVAGYGADDTRSASQYIAQHRTHADTLADHDDQLVLTNAQYPTEQ